ncbi:hypothetical protein EV363DRAFT_1586337 [Boletus edulis]|uniref:Uncharacterized protein n=1 Tax=Boletus edulis BED1 TaxID=1328754 RepID=A0AAD4GGX2_BOLED|nr:hypothetical protein EV363DRAFT_1586337 [Boletus edulis]KAF8444124.1 hypothetical protein L210DRAFT_3643671 [Boletus edulis BED1]
MAPLNHFQAGIWKASLDALDTPSTTTLAWERLPPSTTIRTLPRLWGVSYPTFYIRLADAPAQPRGGTAIATVTLTPDSELVLIRFGGFAGFQLLQVTQGTPPPLHIYTPSTDTWSTVSPI